MMPITAVWVVMMVFFIVIELCTTNLVTIWFALGALAAAFISLFLPNDYVAQLAVFVIVTGVTLMLTRPFVRKFAGKSVRTNANRVIGEEALVLAVPDASPGLFQVKVLGQIWSAKAKDSKSVFEVGQSVIVEEIQGVKLVVRSK